MCSSFGKKRNYLQTLTRGLLGGRGKSARKIILENRYQTLLGEKTMNIYQRYSHTHHNPTLVSRDPIDYYVFNDKLNEVGM